MGRSRASKSKTNGVSIKSNNGKVDTSSDEEVLRSRAGKLKNKRASREVSSTSARRSGRQQKESAARKSDSDSENSDNEAIAKKLKKSANAKPSTSVKRVTLTEPNRTSDEDSDDCNKSEKTVSVIGNVYVYDWQCDC